MKTATIPLLMVCVVALIAAVSAGAAPTVYLVRRQRFWDRG
jgi:hypothetical protein